ncbi:hypothetical protein ACF068_29030 [Streptomyces sp. NPDC016309]|uniref:hypothetical protein n=1 Tax=Streptomyces sp. NPDC016309 TaxID=3364965 RepID=UPI0036F4DC03
MSRIGPVINELVAAAREAPGETVSRLLNSTDAAAVRLGRAILDLQDVLPKPPDPDADEGTHPIDPVTHDPAW